MAKTRVGFPIDGDELGVLHDALLQLQFFRDSDDSSQVVIRSLLRRLKGFDKRNSMVGPARADGKFLKRLLAASLAAPASPTGRCTD